MGKINWKIKGLSSEKTTEKYEEDPNGERIPDILEPAEEAILKQTAARFGVALTKENDVAISGNHHEIMKIIERGKGYQRILWRHKDLVERNRVVTLAGKTRRCTIIKGLLKEKESATS